MGWFNNSVREELMRSQFMANYRAAVAAGDAIPRVLIKAGSNHLMQGRSLSTNTFPIGNFFHEVATFNGLSAVSIAMVPIQAEQWTSTDQLPSELQVLRGHKPINEATLVDVRPLRNYFHNGSRFGLKDPLSGAKFRDLVFGTDFVMFFPSRHGAFSLTGTPEIPQR